MTFPQMVRICCWIKYKKQMCDVGGKQALLTPGTADYKVAR